jgi:hypothetical protein
MKLEMEMAEVRSGYIIDLSKQRVRSVLPVSSHGYRGDARRERVSEFDLTDLSCPRSKTGLLKPTQYSPIRENRPRDHAAQGQCWDIPYSHEFPDILISYFPNMQQQIPRRRYVDAWA